MVKIRLRRTGAKKKPTYRVVVADSRTPRDGRFIEIVGHYNPRTEPAAVKIHEDRILHWLSVGAQPTDSVKRLLQNLGTLDRFARLKQGEDLEELLAEAVASHEEQAKEAEVQAQAAKAAAKKEIDTPETSVASKEEPAETTEDSATSEEESSVEVEESSVDEVEESEVEETAEEVEEASSEEDTEDK